MTINEYALYSALTIIFATVAILIVTPKPRRPPRTPTAPVWQALMISETPYEYDLDTLIEAKDILTNYSPGAYVYEIRAIENELIRRDMGI